MQGRLLIFCGIPGSGKTTIARLVAKAYPGSVHIQTDALRWMITEPNFNAQESGFVYAAAIAIAREALDVGRLVILDATFGYQRRREETLSLLSGHYAKAVVIYVSCDLQTALTRNAAREGAAVVPEKNLMDILRNFEEPAGALRLDCTKDPRECADMVIRTLLYPLVPPE